MLPPNTTTYSAEYTERHSRLTTFFRLLLVIPHAFVLALYGFVVSFAVFFAWFAIVFTAKYPQGLYDFVAGYARYYGRVLAYYYLLADPYPPFSGKVEETYSAELAIGPRLETYSRLLTFFRIILIIPVGIIAYVLVLVAGLITFLGWFVILITGKLPAGMHRIIEFGVSYQARAYVYYLLLTEAFPAFDGSPEAVLGAAATAPGAPDTTTVDGIGDPPR